MKQFEMSHETLREIIQDEIDRTEVDLTPEDKDFIFEHAFSQSVMLIDAVSGCSPVSEKGEWSDPIRGIETHPIYGKDLELFYENATRKHVREVIRNKALKEVHARV